MGRARPKTVLFLDPDPQRGRRAESLFNEAARKLGAPWQAVCLTSAATDDDLARADHLETWDSADSAADTLEQRVLDLLARLLGGRPAEAAPPLTPPQPAPGPRPMARVGRETKGRRGKGVTIVFEVSLDAAGLQELAAQLKQQCGTGGTVKDGRIEIQGDQRERIMAELQRRGYTVKRTGG